MEIWEPTWPGRPPGAGSLGQRIAALRVDRGWTQQQLADRLGISRVAVSHLETDLNTPGERTVALLAGVFRTEPHDLVAGTSYPTAKADRLPSVVARWTEAEQQVALLGRDLWWLADAGVEVPASVVASVLASWDERLRSLSARCHDDESAALLADARDRIRRRRGVGRSGPESG